MALIPFSRRVLFRASGPGRRLLLVLLASMAAAGAGWAQVSPPEIRDPDLRQLETTYLQQLKTLHHSISSTRFPFPFSLVRYVGAGPKSAAAADSRGIEFVRFHERTVLKITGNYNAALNSAQLTMNERAARVFHDVFVPVLRLVRRDIPEDAACDAIGFEVSYHVLGKSKAYDFEGREILVAVFGRDDAFALAAAESDPARQEIVNRSELFVDGKDFGLALGRRDPVDLDALRREPLPAADSRKRPAEVAAGSESSLAPAASPRILLPSPPTPGSSGVLPGRRAAALDEPPASAPGQGPPATQADVDRLQSRYQVQLDALAKEGLLKFHFVDYAPPSFVLFHHRVYLQITMRNSQEFDPAAGSIYKRAAQSFDLFLAAQLKGVVERISPDLEIEGLDVTLLNHFSGKPAGSSPSSGSQEAIEFALPLKALRQFLDADITNQQLLDQSIVLVNGVRIALNLQQVE
jgi:hypothetical protein